MLKAFHYCNNCGKTGHAFHQCKFPITSIGVIVYRKDASQQNVNQQDVSQQDGNIKYLMISRKDSLGFVEFIRGKYQLYNELYLRTIIDGMTNKEKKYILEEDFDTLLNFINKLSNDTISKRSYQEIKITNNSLIIIKI